ncbi:hypothetical protein J4558_02470 [Leptolyngbya sp. 15MV]|nr:hypothetical protein J4558_02470 [Leptolyngbya sp. 15MV]
MSRGAIRGKAFRMDERTGNIVSREERLAAKLRENLRRRKAQARELAESDAVRLPKSEPRS